jgi:hypothetical protein
LSISYVAHSANPLRETQRRVDFLKRVRPEWFGGVLAVSDARKAGKFDRRVAFAFGIDSRCQFSLHVLNKDWLDTVREAIEYVYEVFGTEDLVVTFETDAIRPPLRAYAPMSID